MRKLLVLAAGICFLLAGASFAFHDAGVAHCNGCHTMHNSQDGVLVDPDSPTGNAWLLVDETPSDVCLGCHADHLGAVLWEDPLNPAPLLGAGNFIFLLEDNLNDGHAGGATDTLGNLLNAIPGDAAGHNLDAPGYGLAPDGTHSTSPGGGFPAAVMGCSSCHDPHGTEDFRMLYGAGRVVQAGVATFTNAAPIAIGLGPLYAAAPESPSNHTAYQSGMSAWCGNCHGEFHQKNGGSDLIHPSGQTMGGTIASIYNLYNGTADIIGGAAATAYLPEVPFEDPANTTTSTAGPSGSSQVSCISCHRAHASSAPDAGRWDFSVTFLDEDGVESGSYAIPNPYGPNQRSLCNKCHKKDEFDELPF